MVTRGLLRHRVHLGVIRGESAETLRSGCPEGKGRESLSRLRVSRMPGCCSLQTTAGVLEERSRVEQSLAPVPAA